MSGLSGSIWFNWLQMVWSGKLKENQWNQAGTRPNQMMLHCCHHGTYPAGAHSLADMVSPCCPCHAKAYCCGCGFLTMIEVVATIGHGGYGWHWWGVVEDVVEGRGLWVVDHRRHSCFGTANVNIHSEIKDWLQPVFDWLLNIYKIRQPATVLTPNMGTCNQKRIGLWCNPVQSYIYFQSCRLDLETLCEVGGLYTPPHILVGLHLESGWVQMESWSPSTIFSLVATQPNISPESTWSLPGVQLPSRWTHLDWMDSTSEHRELLINPARLQMESSQINNYITIVVII